MIEPGKKQAKPLSERRQPRPPFPKGANGSVACITVRFDDDQYIPPELWKAWKPPAGWRKSGFYIRGNRDINDGNRFILVFPYARLFCYDVEKVSAESMSVINATLKLMQRPYP